MTTNRYTHEIDTLATYSRLSAELTDTPYLDRIRIEDPDTLYEFVAPMLTTADREHALTLTLDTKHRPIRLHLTSVGSIDHTFMSPRDILRDALADNAAAMALIHNHPSGDPEPSRDDERITRRITEAARTVGVELLDHLVVGAGGWVSCARRGLI